MRYLGARLILVCSWLFAGLVSGSPAAAHQGHVSDAPWKACAAQALGDRCSYENDHHEVHRGSCRSIYGALVCVRNTPIERSAKGHDETEPSRALTSSPQGTISPASTPALGAAASPIRWLPWISLVGLSLAAIAATLARRIVATRAARRPDPA